MPISRGGAYRRSHPVDAPLVVTSPTIGVAEGDTAGVYADLASAVADAARETGHDVRRVADHPAACDVDVVLAIGYPSYFPWLSEPIRGVRLGGWPSSWRPLTRVDSPLFEDSCR